MKKSTLLTRSAVFVGVTSSILAFSTTLTTAIPLGPSGVVPGLYEPDPAGALVQLDQVIANYSAVDLQGQVISTVYSGDINNPYGGLTFTYEVIAYQTSTEAVRRFTVANFDSFLTDVSYDNLVLPGVVPATVDRSFSGNVVGFDFPLLGTPIVPGQNSALLVVQTDALAWQPGIASVIDGSAQTVASLVPVVPEPTTAALLGLGAFALIASRRRR